MKRTRSATHPVYSIEFCLDYTEKIYKNYGAQYYASREDLATIFNQSSAAQQQKISSCVQYGMLELKSGDGYRVSDLFTKYYRPSTSDIEIGRRESLLEMFKNPTVYQSIVEMFDGNILPAERPLSNILFQL